jgi:glucokinase
VATGKEIVNDVAEEIRNLVREQGLSRVNQVLAVVIGLPASVNPTNGNISFVSLYDEWKEVNFKQSLENVFGIPVYPENDVNLSALGEKHFGVGESHDNFVFVEISRGIGAGIILENNLYRSKRCLAGEIGYSIVGGSILSPELTNVHTLEKVASVHAIRQRAVSGMDQHPDSLILKFVDGDVTDIDKEVICSASLRGDELASQIMDDMTTALAICFVNLTMMYDPDLLVIGGELCALQSADQSILTPIREKMLNYSPVLPPEIKISSLHEDACTTGACFLGLDAVISSTFSYKVDHAYLDVEEVG